METLGRMTAESTRRKQAVSPGWGVDLAVKTQSQLFNYCRYTTKTLKQQRIKDNEIASLLLLCARWTFSCIFTLFLSPLFRYYAICCQPLVYRNKMTPMRVALMISGCWVIPTFISFLPIMQGWNSIGIDDLVSCVVLACL